MKKLKKMEKPKILETKAFWCAANGNASFGMAAAGSVPAATVAAVCTLPVLAIAEGGIWAL